MASREKLQALLEDILGSRQVYFQPPESVRMSYPAIVYNRRPINNTFANDAVYKQANSYDITVIDKDPESGIVIKLSQLPLCRHDRHFKADNLNHDVFTLYF